MGTLTVMLARATASEIKSLRKMCDDSRGDYRLRFVVSDLAPIEPGCYVPNDEGFLDRLRSVVPRASVEVAYSERAFEDGR